MGVLAAPPEHRMLGGGHRLAQERLVVRGARQHNLKNIDLDIPRDALVVFTGISGSGKSSLAFDTIYAEGQRRYVESLSSYARQFLGQMDKPDVDDIQGLSPAISIDQKTTSHNPRSTVGTVTEIYDYLRLLYARIGHPHCPNCGRPITSQAVEQMVDQVLTLPEGTRVQVLGPMVRGRKGEHGRLFEEVRRAGFVRVRVDGAIIDVSDGQTPALAKNKKHTVEVVVDRLVVRPDAGSRLAEALEKALEWGGGLAVVAVGEGSAAAPVAAGSAAEAGGDAEDAEESEGDGGQDEGEGRGGGTPPPKVGGDLLFSQRFACPECGTSIDELAPRLFSFNNPFGACPACTGLGVRMEVDPGLVMPNRRRSIADGGVGPWGGGENYFSQLITAVALHFGVDPSAPLQDAPPEFIQKLLYGAPGERIDFEYKNMFGKVRPRHVAFEGVVPMLERYHKEARSPGMRQEIEQYMTAIPCDACKGKRLKPEALAVTVGGVNIADLTAMTVIKGRVFLQDCELTERERLIGRQILKEIDERLGFLANVGLDYLTLSRAAGTLSGGESQRIRLATQIGSGLVGVLYILDEPSIGLHQRDNARLITTLKRLRDLGNTLIVVEHDEETIRAADYLVDIGPGAGAEGGHVVATGTPDEVAANPASVTGDFLSGRRHIPIPEERRGPAAGDRWLTVRGAAAHNLKRIDVSFPLARFTCVTGVSGSGKSSLVNEVLYKRLAADLNGARIRPGPHGDVLGLDGLTKVVDVDQSPIGRTPRSNPATYTGVFDDIRDLFARTPEARTRGYSKGRFSFNVRGGRCEACSGDGIIKIEMHFLPDVYVPCEVCKGRRYNRETLEVLYRGRSISDVLEMSATEASAFFAAVPAIRRRLQTIVDVGLGYIRLGQPATTLSGGEAQRVKLATELSRRSDGGAVYILDEPTTGLHAADIEKLLQVLHRLVDAGDTVIVIEHNLDVIKTADWIVDLGPEGGDRGGEVVAVGTPEHVAMVHASYTGQFLRRALDLPHYAQAAGQG